MTDSFQHRRSARRFGRRAGSVLVEFSLIALTSYLILAAVLTFGLMLFQANVVQSVVDAGAQEMARMPLPADAVLGLNLVPNQSLKNFDANTFQVANDASDPTNAMSPYRVAFSTQIYDEQYLYIPQSQLGGQDLLTYAASLPLINRLLVPTMIFDPELQAYRYPGAVVTNNTTGHTTVLVPVVNYTSSTITWMMPVEEVLIPDGQGNYYSQFNATTLPANAPQNFVPGMVALRINYPSQSAVMSGFEQPATPGGPTMANPLSADDTALSESNSLSNYSLVLGDNAGYTDGVPGTHGGKYGLGRQLAYARELGVRPFREVISAQAAYRREAFSQ